MVERPLRGREADPLPRAPLDPEGRVEVRGVHCPAALRAPREDVVLMAHLRGISRPSRPMKEGGGSIVTVPTYLFLTKFTHFNEIN